jgi:hypothetical protein
VAPGGYYADSTGGPAFREAVLNALRAEGELVEGTKEFFSAGEATAEMGTSVRETVDSSRLESLAGAMRTLKLFRRGEMVAALAGTGECALPRELDEPVRISTRGTPDWTKMLPADALFDYAVGVSEPYYYESSSWQEAERNARLELARSLRLQVRSRQRLLAGTATGPQYDAVWDESVTVMLRGVRVMGRWMDSGTGIYMVLVRTPK